MSVYITHKRLRPILLCLLTLASTNRVFADEQQQASHRLQFFETRIRPLLHAKCVKCHGQNQQEGGLRLDSLEALLAGGESGSAAVAHKPADSLMLEAVRYESFEMPPDKPLSDGEIADLERWITDGLTWPQIDGQSIRMTGAAFSPEERNFWSFQPIRHPEPPSIKSSWAQNEVDRFVAAKLDALQLQPAPQATEEVLVRRLYFDLLGVPPSPVEVRAFMADSSDLETKVSSLIDRLLSDPRYGEHLGRYWLDIVRYAESDGFRADSYRPDAWRYRDYVVNAFNTDKPYDRFITEQLAGDEVGQGRGEALVATGFLRTYLYEYNQRDARTQWQDILNQVTDVTGEAFLGISVGCARCHDHKFDPVLQEDYYRLRAAFGTMLPRDDVAAADLADRQRRSSEYALWQSKAQDLNDELQRLKQPYMDRAARKSIKMFPEDIQEIMAKRDQDRNVLESQLADLVNRQVDFEQRRAKYSDADKQQIEDLKKQIQDLAGKPPATLPVAMTVADVGPQPFALHVGNNLTRKAVTVGGFSMLDPDPLPVVPTKTSSGQRSALAKWITAADNPLTARVIVNRIWQHHFGTGLVATASDFGSLGGQPTHPDLLDWMASEFIANGWSIKWLHHEILNSATWQMSSTHPQASVAEKLDPDNQLRWRFAVRRLSAEQIRDAMLTVSGELKSEVGGASVDHKSFRRSIYLKAMRNKPEPLLSSLDGVDGLNSVAKRSTTTTPTQALNLMNGSWVRERADAMAGRLLDEWQVADTNTLDRVTNAAFQLALGRLPDDQEQQAANQLVRDAQRSRQQSHSPDTLAELTSHSGPALPIGNHGALALATQAPHPKMSAPFTVACLMQLDSLYPSANVRTLVSQWNNQKTTRGWSIGVTSTKSAFKPRNLILQPIGDTGYEVVASNLRPELHRPYFVAVSVEQTPGGQGQATFYLRPAQSKVAQSKVAQSNAAPSKAETVEIQTAVVRFKSAKGFANDLPIVVGGRSTSNAHTWDGAIDQVALFNRSLDAAAVQRLFSEHLHADAVQSLKPTAFWSFDQADDQGKPAAGTNHRLNIRPATQPQPFEYGVAELCHVLLNSNEFVYLD